MSAVNPEHPTTCGCSECEHDEFMQDLLAATAPERRPMASNPQSPAPSDEIPRVATEALNVLLQRTCIPGVQGADVAYVRQVVRAMHDILDRLHVVEMPTAAPLTVAIKSTVSSPEPSDAGMPDWVEGWIGRARRYAHLARATQYIGYRTQDAAIECLADENARLSRNWSEQERQWCAALIPEGTDVMARVLRRVNGARSTPPTGAQTNG